MIRRIVLLLLVCLSVTPANVAIHPTLHLFTANNQGRADLLLGDSVVVVIELREAQAARATLQHLTPSGLILESARASSGDVVTTPFVSWAGAVAAGQAINIVLIYRVAADAVPGDRVLRAQAQVNGVGVYASAVLRICCVAAPAARGWRMYLASVRH